MGDEVVLIWSDERTPLVGDELLTSWDSTARRPKLLAAVSRMNSRCGFGNKSLDER